VTWRQILDGKDAERARALTTAIGNRLAAETASPPGLGAGAAGRAMCLAYLACDDARFAAARDAAIRITVDEIAATATDPSLYAGFTGVAWLLCHLGDAGDAYIDDALERMLGRETIDHDLLTGLTGIGVYALERRSRALAQRVVDKLAARAVLQREGTVAWSARPGELSAAGGLSLGVAHGTAGVVAFLAAARSSGISDKGLLDRALRWLLAHRMDGGSRWGGSEQRPRSAWCNGDAGIAGAILAAARSTGHVDLLDVAVAMARKAARRIDPHVVEAGLCHGAAGLAHIYNRAWQASGDAELRDAARAWYDRAVAATDAANEPAGFLTGLAGIGLALAAATGSKEPAWDRVLLLS
jgi:hypothetical protein